MFSFKPMSKEELEQQGRPLASGPCNFEIMSATQTESKNSGNPMLVVSLKIWDCTGKQGFLKDYITSGASWKIHALLKSIGHEEDYYTGVFDPHKYNGKAGALSLKYKREGDREWPRMDYLAPDAKNAPGKGFFDDIPF